jgi:serine/threonine-protein kinase
VNSPDPDALRGLPVPGEVLSGKYEIERVLGMGGMGVVLAARHVGLGQRVAVKMLRPEIARLPEAAERFLREARASTTLRSEHVARVLDVGKLDNGAPYMVMEFLEGKDLHALASGQSQLPIAASVGYMLQAAEALAEAHATGIVHRDLKPANLFLTAGADGSPLVKVLDFGISKANLPGERGITATDAVLGSPGYMSPEQIRSAKHVDQRADVWGLGVTLYELLTGVPPFDGASVAAVSVQIVLETPKLVHERRPDIPQALSEVVRRCLEKEPGKRYGSMAELAEALLPFAPAGSAPAVERIRRISRGSIPFGATLNASDLSPMGQVSAGTDGNWERPKERIQRRMLVLVAGAVFVVAVLLASVFALGRRSAEDTSAPEASAHRASQTAPAAAPPLPEPRPAAVPSAAAASVAVPMQPVPSASAEPVTRRVPVSRPAPKAQCPKDQVFTNGHCCPRGLVWQNGGCDRPLATSLP